MGRYAQKKCRKAFIAMKTSLLLLGLTGGCDGTYSVCGELCRRRNEAQTPLEWQNRRMIPFQIIEIVSNHFAV
jgi:hypothetical protein